MASKFAEWVVMVVGGASGLGRATAQQLVQEGAKVCIMDRDQDNGAQLASQLAGKDDDRRAIFVKVDIRSESDVKAAIAECRRVFGRVDALINCAAITTVTRVVDPDTGLPHPLDSFQNIIDVNLVGTFNTCRLVAAAMKDNTPNKDGQRGVIVNVSSTAGIEGQVYRVAYAASKAALNGMTLPMARDLAEFGIRVVTVAPGPFNTPLLATVPESETRTTLKHTVFPKRVGEPEEVTHLMMAVLDNPMINGEVIRIDGGMRLPKTFV